MRIAANLDYFVPIIVSEGSYWDF